ncbi:tetratricopeptide repeat protein [Luteolibacter pohnpeiensis]|uniref:Tetratricopeptide repeat protein n=1 Tax=Luteolibacter pohnpeiensis TaxID=454153 RepID=A0A934VXK8_9BACT|nr:tetratricopeptide repeat protein [Luteolibacter pohnpeiensis]MBK1883958.1 tetratricopeptide repeat protein [Luteolibacter pohnpeiensis]
MRTAPALALLLPVLICIPADGQAPLDRIGQNPAPAVSGGKTASELLATGEKAYNAGNWEAAATAFENFITNYAGLEGTEAAITRVKPLLAICQVRLGKLEEAVPLLEESLALSGLDENVRVDLLFFSGIAHMRTGKADVARQNLGKIFNDAKVERGRRMEALVLAGMTYILEQNWKEAISFFQRYGDEIHQFSAEAGARADILLLHALMQEQQWDEANVQALKLDANLDQVRQVVTFSTLMIQLGAHFLDEGEPYKAIALLQRVPNQKKIERLQTAMLTAAQADLKFASAAGNSIRVSQLQTSVEEMQRELDAFSKMPEFDSAARLRLASAYFGLGRTREGCLILDQMVRQMEPDSIVESATASLMRGWMSLERYARAARTADLYIERCGNLAETPNKADVLFLKAQAIEGQSLYREAADAYLEVAKEFPDQPIGAQAQFMAAYNVLQLENYDESGSMLDQQAKSLKVTDAMWPHVIFWRAMAYYFDQQWEPCRQQLEKYLTAVDKDHIDAEYVDDARFRIAYSHFSEALYPEAIKELKQFETEFPTSEWLAEALLTLGDCQAAEGDLEDAAASYSRIGIEAPGFYDEGWMKRGNLLKVQKDLPGMKKLFTEFLQTRPESPRIAEALQWLGWIAKQQGDLDEARKIYWEAISKFGNDAVRPGLEDIFLALQGFYSGSDRKLLETRFSDELAKAQDQGHKRMAVRLGWALAKLRLATIGSTDPHAKELRQQRYQIELAALVSEIEPKDTAPMILADVGDALAANGDTKQAKEIYEGLRKWWPRSPERDRAYAGLGFASVKEGNEPEALEDFDRFEKTSIMPRSTPDENGITLVQSDLGGEVAIARSKLLANRDPEKSLQILLALQRSKAMPARIRGEAFLEAGRRHVSRQQFREALPYFEQVYLLFNRYPALVASAYFERGQALEKLGLPDKAREVYSELVTRDDLKGTESTKQGLERAQALGGVLAPKNPEGALVPPSSSHD